MSTNNKFLYTFISIIFFIALPSLFFVLAEVSQRTVLKDSISIFTILAFFILIGQFYLSKINEGVKELFKIAKVIKIHKIIGYVFVPILLIHPFLIVVPRFFEVGADPIESFIKMITTFDNLGVILGLVTWVLMLTLGLTSMFRNKMKMTYKSWKILHGVLSFTFIAVASWHAIDIGRHFSLSMSILIIVLCFLGSLLLLKSYIFTKKKIKVEKKEIA